MTDKGSLAPLLLPALIVYLLIPGGIERTDVEFHELVEPVGLKVERVIPTSSLVTLVELVRA